MIRVLLRLVFLIALTFAPSVAFAKTVREELPKAAQEAWDRGRTLFDAKKWLAARNEFQSAYDASHNPRVLFNVAVCEKELGHYVKAAGILRRELSEGAGKLPKDDLETIKGALSALEPLQATLEVICEEPDVVLTIDGEESGKSPFSSPIPIDTGEHTIKLAKPGFTEVLKEKYNVASGKVARLEVTMEPLEKNVEVTITVAGPKAAAVLVDGRDMGNAPFTGPVREGHHVFEATADDWVTARKEVDLVYKKPATIALTMSSKRHEGILIVTTTPAGATIEIDGKPVGVSEWQGPLTSGTGHKLVVKKDGFYTDQSEVVLSDDQRRTVPITLKTEKNWIWWALGGAAVLVGVVVVGYFALAPAPTDPVPGSLEAGRGWGIARFP